MNMKEAPKSLAKALLLPINPAAVVILGIYTVCWGLWVANPFWTVFTQAPLYSTLATAAPDFVPAEVFWGCVAIFCGLVITYGAVRRRYRPLIVGAATAGWHWFMISFFYFMGDWQNTGGITALVLCIYGAFIYINIRVNFKDRRHSDEILR